MASTTQALAHAAGAVFLRAGTPAAVAASLLVFCWAPMVQAEPGDTALVSRSPLTHQAASGFIDTAHSISATVVPAATR